jgi:hypothetical protein
MNKLVGMCVLLGTFVILLGTVVAQDTPPGPPKGAGKGGFGGGKGGGLMAPDAFMTKYDANKDGKVTKEEYLKVSQDDLKTQWDAIASKAATKDTVSSEEYTKYYDDKKAAFGAPGGFPGGGKKGPPMP